MASACRFIRRTALPFIKSAVKSNVRTTSLGATVTAPASRVPLSNCTAPGRRFSLLSRSPAELGGVQSLLPLHSAVAVAKLTSCLSSNSRSCRALSQDGIDGT
ncbi:protein NONRESPONDING TO OXYLIPINS 2, mitochondrial-like isoform X2 [Telopea speciosissima]|uniref:protein NONRESPONDING TO OXYLIPINS 2, mitochondrial-like isoform X2 n=1 Tax=Telopea speciosissima TaxID=54955 RepID=UPI001CC4AF07|nr:protein NONRESPONDING TO OXYLIPINS 2, mitochondrial-like isoform X2 [Telopea speciosissima]